VKRPIFCKATMFDYLQKEIEILEKLSPYDRGERRFAITLLKRIQSDIVRWSRYKPKVHWCKAMDQAWRDRDI